QMQERMAMMEEVRRTRHDMKNHMIYVQELIRNHKEYEAGAYLDEFVKGTLKNSIEIVQSGNLLIDSLINNKYAVAKKNNVKMILELSIPSVLKYKASDWCIVVGNLLDNAIEASKKCCGEKTVIVKIKYTREKYFLLFRNTYEGERRMDKEGKFITTKSDATEHGIGMESVKKVIDTYKGVIDIKVEKGWFQVRAYF
ncbi:MAG: GHKL domain-containing protein, partial [Clostridia bacterium]|nr:GHKL domain-containing protein [Clostridia bacterium]